MSPRLKFCYEVPNNNIHDYKIELDKTNSNSKSQDDIPSEIDQKMEHETCIDLGHKTKGKPLPDFKKIRVYFVRDVKYDGSHNTRLVAESHLTYVPLSSACSGVVSLKNLVLK